MCKICNTKPVYEFTNKRKVCKNCFIRWFNKKVLYTIRKFNLIKKDEIVGYESGKDFRQVVLREILEMYNEKAMVELVKLRSPLAHRLMASVPGQVQGTSPKKLVNEKKVSKVAISNTIDSESQKIIHELIKGDVNGIKAKPVERAHPPTRKKTLIKPLFLFTDKEVLLYAKLKKLKFNKIKKEKIDKLNKFVDDLEKKHPEVKRAVVKGIMELS